MSIELAYKKGKIILTSIENYQHRLKWLPYVN